MHINTKKRIFLVMFCMASVFQGMYSTYFVSILTTIERLYQIQSKTAGAIMSATEIGQIIGSILIAHYGGKGNKPKWIAACMTLTAIAALVSVSPHFILNYRPLTPSASQPYQNTDLNSIRFSISSYASILDVNQTHAQNQSKLSNDLIIDSTIKQQLCQLPNSATSFNQNSSLPDFLPLLPIATDQDNHNPAQTSANVTLVIFFSCLLAIGFGSTAITTLGIPFIDDIVTKEESPLYLGLSIGLRIFGPALGFLLGSFCMQLNIDPFKSNHEYSGLSDQLGSAGCWWLGPVLISIPLLILALPMYQLSPTIPRKDHKASSDFDGITYQAAEDHDIGGSGDFQAHVLTVCDLDVTSDQTCYSEVDSSSREVLQAPGKSNTHSVSQFCRYNFGKNITLEEPVLTRQSILTDDPKSATKRGADGHDGFSWRPDCLAVNQFDHMESSNFTNDEAKSLKSNSSSTSHKLHCDPLPSPTPSSDCSYQSASEPSTTTDLASSLSRLIRNRLLLLRMLSSILHILPIAGFYTFFPKYLSEQFRAAPSSASAISGLAGILFVGMGAFLGGTIVRILNVNSRLMSRWIATSALLFSLGMIILMNIDCSQNQTVYYESADFVSTDCMSSCQCTSNVFNPVCANGTTYISPCLAGCKGYTKLENKIIYEECGCSRRHNLGSFGLTNVLDPEKFTHDPMNLTQTISNNLSTSGHINLNVATQGHCLMNCDSLLWYIVIFSTFTLIHASCEVGAMMFNLRCVKKQDRTLALGLLTFSSSLLGTIPCSVIYGTMIDLTCVHWDSIDPKSQSSASGYSTTRGACRAYDNDSFRYYLHGTTALVMLLAFIVDCAVSRRANEINFYTGDLRQKGDQLSITSKQNVSSYKKSIETI